MNKIDNSSLKGFCSLQGQVIVQEMSSHQAFSSLQKLVTVVVVSWVGAVKTKEM